VLRSGAQAGDDIWVSGTIGGGLAGLLLHERKLEPSQFVDGGEAVKKRYNRPQARVSLGRILAKRGLASAMIDISDGLFQDCGHILQRSAVRALLYPDEIPLEPGVAGCMPLLSACSGGDDYELLFTAPVAARDELYLLGQSGTVGLSRIGEILPRESGDQPLISLRTAAGGAESLEAAFAVSGLKFIFGHQHFR
jgi:thiamine-monophosphate kinase